MRAINHLPITVLAWNPGSRTLKPKRRRLRSRKRQDLSQSLGGLCPKLGSGPPPKSILSDQRKMVEARVVTASHEQVSSPFQVGSGVLGEAHGGIPKGNDPPMALFLSSVRPKGPDY